MVVHFGCAVDEDNFVCINCTERGQVEPTQGESHDTSLEIVSERIAARKDCECGEKKSGWTHVSCAKARKQTVSNFRCSACFTDSHPVIRYPIVEDQIDFVVRGCMDHSDEDGSRKFKILWSDYSWTWEPQENLSNCAESVNLYCEQNDLELLEVAERVGGAVGSGLHNTSLWLTMQMVLSTIRIFEKKGASLPIVAWAKGLEVSQDMIVVWLVKNHFYVVLLTSTRGNFIADGQNFCISNPQEEIEEKLTCKSQQTS